MINIGEGYALSKYFERAVKKVKAQVLSDE